MFAEFTPAFLTKLVERAERSPRRRQHANIHARHSDPVQRLFNAICVDSYIRPHRHKLDPKQELLIAVRGRFSLILFDKRGEVSKCVTFGCHPNLSAGVEVEPIQWHTVVALEAGSILLEVKQGPFEAAAAKELAPWSPSEDDIESVGYLRYLRERAGGASAMTLQAC